MKLVHWLFPLLFWPGLHAAAETTGRPSILVLMADDWSAPHAGVLNAPVVKTPAFDRVAREGVLFEQAYASCPSCTASRLALAAGQWQWCLQEGANLGGSLHEEVKVYAELLQAAGYQTGFARKGAEPSDQRFTHRDPFGARFKSFEEFQAQRDTRKPFCFWYGAGEPHRPYHYQEGSKDGMDPSKVTLPACLPDHEISRNDFCDYLHQVQRYDADAARMIALLEKSGELDNTIIVMSGDNGLPFPRCKSTLYDTGTHVPLAIRWGARLKAGRSVDDFVSLCDLAPTFLEAAGVAIPPEMTGRSLIRALHPGPNDPTRNHVLSGMDKHTYPTPARAIRTKEFLYIENVNPQNWPTGDTGKPWPKIDHAAAEWPVFEGAFSFNIDPSPTKQFILDHRNEPAVKPFFNLACAPHPGEELYDLDSDPDQLHNVAALPRYQQQRDNLRERLHAELYATHDPRFGPAGFETRDLAGWTVFVSATLKIQEPDRTAHAVTILAGQLANIVKNVPATAVAALHRVPIWLTPPPPSGKPSIEYHAHGAWLDDNGRDVAMAKGVQISNIARLEEEAIRMPWFALHELAHAYHDQVLGFDDAEIKAAFVEAKASGIYDNVERWLGNGKPNTFERAYAMTNEKEYFAECSEAFFGRNDFFPFTRDQLKKHDPRMFGLLERVWGVSLPE